MVIIGVAWCKGIHSEKCTSYVFRTNAAVKYATQVSLPEAAQIHDIFDFEIIWLDLCSGVITVVNFFMIFPHLVK